MQYNNEYELKKEIVLINNSKKIIDKNKTYHWWYQYFRPHCNIDVIDEIIQEIHEIDNSKDLKPRKKKELIYEKDELLVEELSKCFIPNYSKERFGEMVLLQLKKYASKPQYSSYTNNWKDDFYIDAVGKIFKYMHNFNPKITSKREGHSGKRVKAFGYITQIIHHSFLSVINKKKDDKKKINEEKEILSGSFYGDIELKTHNFENKSRYYEILLKREEAEFKTYRLSNISSLLAEIQKINEQKVTIYYPSDYKISIEEYEKITEYTEDNDMIVRILKDNNGN